MYVFINLFFDVILEYLSERSVLFSSKSCLFISFVTLLSVLSSFLKWQNSFTRHTRLLLSVMFEFVTFSITVDFVFPELIFNLNLDRDESSTCNIKFNSSLPSTIKVTLST